MHAFCPFKHPFEISRHSMGHYIYIRLVLLLYLHFQLMKKNIIEIFKAGVMGMCDLLKVAKQQLHQPSQTSWSKVQINGICHWGVPSFLLTVASSYGSLPFHWHHWSHCLPVSFSKFQNLFQWILGNISEIWKSLKKISRRVDEELFPLHEQDPLVQYDVKHALGEILTWGKDPLSFVAFLSIDIYNTVLSGLQFYSIFTCGQLFPVSSMGFTSEQRITLPIGIIFNTF